LGRRLISKAAISAVRDMAYRAWVDGADCAQSAASDAEKSRR
jgi:hypothetical protein